VRAGRSPSQTVGPFFSFALPWPDGPFVVAEATPGAIRVHGRLFDGAGEPVPDGLIETWQVSPAGTRGFGRSATGRDGGYAIVTLKPSAVAGAGGALHAPHLAVSVFARGLLRRTVTRIYFDDEEAANRSDPVLSAIADGEARATLIARREAGGYHLDIHLQGPRETVFFDV
jgi:protocatechuate 3,4-dioxygenase, alpha subunit